VRKPPSFSTNWFPKNVEGQFGLPNGHGRRLAQYFGGFFHHIKVRQKIGRKVSIQPVVEEVGELEVFLY
jgi:hypothetical protein